MLVRSITAIASTYEIAGACPSRRARLIFANDGLRSLLFHERLLFGSTPIIEDIPGRPLKQAAFRNPGRPTQTISLQTGTMMYGWRVPDFMLAGNRDFTLVLHSYLGIFIN
jgi:hypothetical protein